jgi:hypothetical protein
MHTVTNTTNLALITVAVANLKNIVKITALDFCHFGKVIQHLRAETFRPIKHEITFEANYMLGGLLGYLKLIN